MLLLSGNSNATDDYQSKAEIIKKRDGQVWVTDYFEVVGHTEVLNVFSKSYYPTNYLLGHLEYRRAKVRPLVIWTGIVVSEDIAKVPAHLLPAEHALIEHHYWDWKTTLDDHPILVSARGRGYFVCSFGPDEIENLLKIGDFVIIYGIPMSVFDGTEVINMECMKSKIVDSSLYSSDTWDYGEEFIENRDPNDLKILRPDRGSNDLKILSPDI